MKSLKFITALFVFVVIIPAKTIYPQGVSITKESGVEPHESAILHIISDDRGLFLPRMTESNREQIKTPAEGLLIYNTDSNKMEIYLDNGWHYLESVQLGEANGTSSPETAGIYISMQSDYTMSGSAILDLDSPDKGFLLPGSDIDVNNPADGLIYFNTSENNIKFYNDTEWKTPCFDFSCDIFEGGESEKYGVLITDHGGSEDPHHSAILEIRTDKNKGLLIPALTSATRDDLYPEQGLIIYNITDKKINYTDGDYWYEVLDDVPEQPEAITGLDEICAGVQEDFSISPVNGAKYYEWNYTGDGSISGSGTNISLTATTSGNLQVRACNGCGCGDWRDKNINVDDIPDTPTDGTHIAGEEQIEWHWSSVPDADGYRWHTSNNYGAAEDVGTSTSYTETGLECETSYTRYVWAYNDCGESNPVQLTEETDDCEVSFENCGDDFLYNGHYYPTVEIYDQCWFAENLVTAKYNDNSNINLFESDQDAEEATEGGYWWFEFDEDNAYPNGAYYNWFAVETGNLCPDGWEVPSKDELNTLIDDYVGAGDYDKLRCDEHWSGTNDYGFGAIPAGEWNPSDYFILYDNNAIFWSSTEEDDNTALGRVIPSWEVRTTRTSSKRSGFSVRCLKK